MKRMKKFLAVLLAAIMVMSMGTSVFADDESGYTLTVTGNPSHTITAYQLFSGTVSEDGNTLSDIDWGTDISSTTLLSTLVTENTSESSKLKGVFDGISISSSAEDVAAKIANITDSSVLQYLANLIKTTEGIITGNGTSVSETNTSGTYTASVSGGYYLIYDVAGSNVGDSASSYILKILGTQSVELKDTGVPTVDKEITGSNLIGDDGDANTSYVGDTVSYKITVTVPSNFSAYDTYMLTVYDALSDGLSFNNNSVTVKVYSNSDDTTGTTVSNSSYAVVTSLNASSYTSVNLTTNSDDFAVYFSDIKTLSDGSNSITLTSSSKIVITYTATVTESATTGTSANTNTTYATYSNDPKSDSTGTTVTDKTYTYITSLEVTKEDGENQGLADAKFSLYKAVAENYTYNASAGTNYVSTDSAKYYAYDSSSKTMVEITSENASTLTTNGITVYIRIDNETEAKETSENSGTYVAKFGDLSAGSYVLIETTTPDGYNTADPVFFTVTATDSSTDTDGSSVTWTATNTSGGTVSVENGVYKTTVVNNAGTKLPTTGGIGTTIFYVVGAILVLGAAVILVTRRRMANR